MQSRDTAAATRLETAASQPNLRRYCQTPEQSAGENAAQRHSTAKFTAAKTTAEENASAKRNLKRHELSKNAAPSQTAHTANIFCPRPADAASAQNATTNVAVFQPERSATGTMNTAGKLKYKQSDTAEFTDVTAAQYSTPNAKNKTMRISKLLNISLYLEHGNEYGNLAD